MSAQSNPLNPTFEGHIASTLDALILFEACLSGQLNHVPRRPHDRERQDLIKSGNVFIYEEHASGIKRWTDGVSWSPSRILGNFLIYRELDQPFPPGVKKRALKKKKCPPGGITKPELNSRPNMSSFPTISMDTSVGKDTERALIGSLVDSYAFKNDGLIKKTISITYQGIPHHMVSYYNVTDVVSGRLTTPSKHPNTMTLLPRSDLLMSQNFRAPIDEVEYGADERGGPPTLFATLANAHEFGGGSGGMLHRSITLPTYHPMQMSTSYASNYAYNPQPHYMASMSSSMPPPMSQQLSSSMPPLQMHQSASSLQQSMSTPLPTSTGHLSYSPHQQGNYSLDPHKATRFGSDSSLVHEFPRNMPSHSASRRSSAYDIPQPSDMTSISLSSVADGRSSTNGNTYMRQASCYLPSQSTQMASQENHVFTHPRPIKAESELSSVESGTQHYGLDESSSTWEFDAIDSSHGQQYFGSQAGGGSANWHGGPNGVGRS